MKISHKTIISHNFNSGQIKKNMKKNEPIVCIREGDLNIYFPRKNLEFSIVLISKLESSNEKLMFQFYSKRKTEDSREILAEITFKGSPDFNGKLQIVICPHFAKNRKGHENLHINFTRESKKLIESNKFLEGIGKLEGEERGKICLQKIGEYSEEPDYLSTIKKIFEILKKEWRLKDYKFLYSSSTLNKDIENLIKEN